MTSFHQSILPLNITQLALNQIALIKATKNIPQGYGLRIGVRGSGCSGTSFVLGFDQKKEGDNEYLIEGIPVYIEKKHILYVAGIELDYEDSEEVTGFIFNTSAAS
ncbi:MAG TPA: iron-sulfur cluster assembly accessory protein [Cytophaga sp.]|nr:iron-sulfur cluster assembly accessory protein [Cytophaga sp.]